MKTTFEHKFCIGQCVRNYLGTEGKIICVEFSDSGLLPKTYYQVEYKLLKGTHYDWRPEQDLQPIEAPPPESDDIVSYAAEYDEDIIWGRYSEVLAGGGGVSPDWSLFFCEPEQEYLVFEGKEDGKWVNWKEFDDVLRRLFVGEKVEKPVIHKNSISKFDKCFVVVNYLLESEENK